MWAVIRGGTGVLGTGFEPGGAVLLDDVHAAPRHPGRAGHPGPPGPRHGQTHRGGHYEEIRLGGGISRGGAELLAEDTAQNMGPIRRALLL